MSRRALAVALLVCMWSMALPGSIASASVILSKCGAGTHIGGKCVVFLTASPGSLLAWTVPYDWNNNNNSIETIGAGASGGAVGNGAGDGGGGGAWNKATNVTLIPGVSVDYEIGTGGASTTAAFGSHVGGSPGGDTWFCNSTSGLRRVFSLTFRAGLYPLSGGRRAARQPSDPLAAVADSFLANAGSGRRWRRCGRRRRDTGSPRQSGAL
jgi:hypothetical protein